VDVVPYDTPYGLAVAADLSEAEAYCRRLARTHYENFLVASAFVPRRLRQHFYNVYAFCRVADDLADEAPTTERAVQLLDWWESHLARCYSGDPTHPVLMALRTTNDAFGIPSKPYEDLLRAFRQDQVKTRYETYDELLAYCCLSACPVGHLVLHLFGYLDGHRQHLSDATCTALQLANFWQDVARDHDKGRVYVPKEDLRRFGVTEDHIARREFTPAFAGLMRFECDRTAEMFDYGRALRDVVGPRLRAQLDMFTRGGQEVLRRIAAQGYNVLRRRPVIPKTRQFCMLAGAWLRSRLPRPRA